MAADRPTLAIGILACCAACAPSPGTVPSPQSCRAPSRDVADWLATPLGAWREISAEVAPGAEPAYPVILLLHDSCVWRTPVVAEGLAGWSIALGPDTLWFQATPVIDGKVTLPDAREVDYAPTAWAGIGGSSNGPYLAMATPDVFRERLGIDDRTLNARLAGVMIHELVHTLQLTHVVEHLRRLKDLGTLPAEVDDDIVQRTFVDDPAFAHSIALEVQLLYDAGLAVNEAEGRRRATLAIERIRERQRRFFVDSLAVQLELEGLYLNLEGVAEWVRYRFHERRLSPLPGQDRRALLDWQRGRSNAWSQDLGLALLVALERFGPACIGRLFDPAMPSPVDLLERSLADPSGSGCQ